MLNYMMESWSAHSEAIGHAQLASTYPFSGSALRVARFNVMPPFAMSFKGSRRLSDRAFFFASQHSSRLFGGRVDGTRPNKHQCAYLRDCSPSRSGAITFSLCNQTSSKLRSMRDET